MGMLLHRHNPIQTVVVDVPEKVVKTEKQAKEPVKDDKPEKKTRKEKK